MRVAHFLMPLNSVALGTRFLRYGDTPHFLPPAGGSTEFLIPPDSPATTGLNTAPTLGLKPKRAARRSRKSTRRTRR